MHVCVQLWKRKLPYERPESKISAKFTSRLIPTHSHRSCSIIPAKKVEQLKNQTFVSIKCTILFTVNVIQLKWTNDLLAIQIAVRTVLCWIFSPFSEQMHNCIVPRWAIAKKKKNAPKTFVEKNRRKCHAGRNECTRSRVVWPVIALISQPASTHLIIR